LEKVEMKHLTALIFSALLLAGPPARAITYPPALRACAGRIFVALDHIKTLRRNPALDATASNRATAAKATAFLLKDLHLFALVHHKLTQSRAFRHSPAATHIVCLIARAFRADEKVFALAADLAHAPAPAAAPRRAARGVQGQLDLHPRALGGGGATQITHSYRHSIDRSRSIQHTHSDTHTYSISHSNTASRSISYERSETRSRTLTHTFSRGRTRTSVSTMEYTLLCNPDGVCARNSTQQYEAGECDPQAGLPCPNMALLNFEWVDLWTIDDLLVVDAPVAERSLVGR